MLEHTPGYANGKDFEQEVLNTLLNEEISPEEPLPFRLYFYAQDEKAASQCVLVLFDSHPDCPTEIVEQEDGTHLVLILCEQSVKSGVLADLADTLLLLQKQYGGEFDGWEIAPEEPDYMAIGKELLTSMRESYDLAPNFQTVHLNDFQDLDVGFYTTTQQTLAQLGYALIDDIEDKNISQQGMRTCIRILKNVNDNGLAALFYVPTLNLGVIELESRLSDGQVIVSTTNSDIAQIAEWPKIAEQYFASDTTEVSLVEAHTVRVNEYLSQNKNVSVVALNSIDQVIDSAVEAHEHKKQHLSDIGWITLDFLLKQVGDDQLLGLNLFVAIQQILEEEAALE